MDGFSTGMVEGNKLTVTTTHMKYGVIQRNGVPSSEISDDGALHPPRRFLLLISIVNDPTYLEEPFIRTSHWVQSTNVTPDQRFVFEIVDEIAGHERGYVRTIRSGRSRTSSSGVSTCRSRRRRAAVRRYISSMS